LTRFWRERWHGKGQKRWFRILFECSPRRRIATSTPAIPGLRSRRHVC